MEAHGIVALVCISLMVSEAGYLFKYIFVHLEILSYSIQDFIAHLSFDLYDWFVWFLIDLYILETTPLLDICITNIFHCVSSYHF